MEKNIGKNVHAINLKFHQTFCWYTW